MPSLQKTDSVGLSWMMRGEVGPGVVSYQAWEVLPGAQTGDDPGHVGLAK